jgi:Ran GTPase-activating protein (RanGAP) involved in mRNA processing and transport
MAQAGHLSGQELQKIWKAIKDAEKADMAASSDVERGSMLVRPRHVAFGVGNDLEGEHLRLLGKLLDVHPRVSISLDTDWRSADDASLKALTNLLKKRDRCRLIAPDMEGVGTLRLPPNSSDAIVEGLADALTTSVHPEVDGIAFFPPGPWPPPHSIKRSPVVALAPLRQSSQELTMAKCAMGDLGTVAVCAFVRQWAPRIQTIRLTECDIGDAGGAALSRILGSNLRELCLTSNCIGDDGISAIAKALPLCDSLERLLLDRNHIADEGAKALGAHLHRSNVSEVLLGSHLGGNRIGTEGVEALACCLDDELSRAAANRASRLTALNLDGCLIADLGAQALAAALPRSVIMALSVARAHLDDSGAEAIVQALPRTCQSLDLSGNYLTDCSATFVAECFYRIPHLAVSLANNHLTVGLRAILHEEHGTRLRL